MEFRILGPLEVVADGRQIAIRPGNDRLLLTLLLLEANQIVPVDRLVHELWGETPPPSAVKVVQNTISRLRRELGPDRLQTYERGYRLRVEADELDADRFERLIGEGHAGEALELWRGALPTAEGERVAASAARRLEELRLTAVEQQLEVELTDGSVSSAIATLERLASEHPYRERLHALLMRALYGAGRQSEALTAYQRLRQNLANELGLEPAPELQELQRAILNQDPALPRLPEPQQRRRRSRKRRGIGVVVVAAAAVATALALALTGNEATPTVVANSLVRIDARSNEVRDVIRVGRLPAVIVPCAGFVFLVNGLDNTVSRVDPRSGEVSTIGGFDKPLGGLAADGRSIWVASRGTGRLTEIDAASLAVKTTFSVPGHSAWFLAIHGNRIWVTTGVTPNARVVSLRKSDGSVERSFPAAGALELAYGFGAVWVSEPFAGQLVRIDERGNTAGIDVDGLPADPLVAFASVWVASVDKGTVTRIDPVSRRITAIVRTHSVPWSLAAGGGSVWVTNRDKGTVSRIDPATNTITRTIPLGFKPHWVEATDDGVWVGVAAQNIDDVG